MAQRLVPSQYSTIQAAITACASYDEIVVSAGTYPEVLTFTSKNNVLVRAALGEQVIISGTGTIVPFPSTCHRISFIGIKFVRTGTGTSGIVTSASSAVRGCKFIDCIFDYSAMGAMISTTNAFISLYPGDGNSPSLIRRCRFIGNGVTTQFASIVRWFTLAAASQNILCESNTFFNVWSPNLSTLYLLYLNGNSSPGGKYVARNNTFIDCKCYKTLIRVTGGASAAACCYNNVTQRQTFWSPGAGLYIFQCATGLPMFCGWNTGHNSDGVTSFLASPDSGENNFSDPVLSDSEGHMTVTDGTMMSTSIYRTGLPAGPGLERRMHLSMDRIPYAEGPSRGAHEVYMEGGGVLHLKHKYINALNGMVFNMTGQAAPSLPSTSLSFDTPMALAEYVETCIRPTRGLEYGPIEFWYDFENHRYRAACYQSSFDLSCSGNAAILFGTQALVGQSDTG
jgi:hypothetical protein